MKDVFEPVVDGKTDGLFVTKGYDATSHFETSIDDVLEMYTKITNETLDLTNLPVEEEEGGEAPAATTAAPVDGAKPK